MDKSKLVENQLADNLKNVRILTTGTTTLDHLLTVGQCLRSNWGLGFQGSTSKSVEETIFVKGASSEVKIKNESEEEDDQTGEQRVDLDRTKVHKNHSSADVIGGVFDEREATVSSLLDTKGIYEYALQQVVKVHDLEKTNRTSNSQKSIAFVADSKEQDRVTKVEENLGLMSKLQQVHQANGERRKSL
ncbi:hypothetical protein F2Q70_00027313 [Brassica cretica]|uniref:Uncharacterized protein n=1 Tax=Brassica cretica TaxID=69181 RepID=A0A8S9L946_BRACR|nr:hypothetical protein F2Q70_00027313 [Brassica cretica]